MKNFSLYVDSAANIPEEIRRARDIHVIPYHCTVNGEDRLCFDENVPFEETALAHYELLRQGAEEEPQAARSTASAPRRDSGRDVLERLGYLAKTKGYLLGWVLIGWGVLDLVVLLLMGLGVLNFMIW